MNKKLIVFCVFAMCSCLGKGLKDDQSMDDPSVSMKDNKKPGSSDALAADSVPEMEGGYVQQGEEPGEDLATVDGENPADEVQDGGNGETDDDSSQGDQDSDNTNSGPDNSSNLYPDTPELSLLGAETLNTGLTIDRIVAQCERLLDRSLKKKALYLTRKAKISSGHKKSDLFVLRNVITLERLQRIARKMARLECVDGIDISSLSQTNHMVNGSFELKVVDSSKSWDFYSQKQTPGWRVRALEGDAQCADDHLVHGDGTSGAVEFQTIRTRVLSDGFIGNQFAELDSHCRSDRNLDTRVSIFQRIETIPGQTYELKLLASSRNGFGHLGVLVKGIGARADSISKVLKEDSADESLRLQRNQMKQYSFTFTANSYVTEVRLFDADERKKTFGVLVDAVDVRLKTSDTN